MDNMNKSSLLFMAKHHFISHSKCKTLYGQKAQASIVQRIWMYENFDGSSSNQTKGAQNVASRLSVEPVDCVSFGDHNECLKHRDYICINAE